MNVAAGVGVSSAASRTSGSSSRHSERDAGGLPDASETTCG